MIRRHEPVRSINFPKQISQKDTGLGFPHLSNLGKEYLVRDRLAHKRLLFVLQQIDPRRLDMVREVMWSGPPGVIGGDHWGWGWVGGGLTRAPF